MPERWNAPAYLGLFLILVVIGSVLTILRAPDWLTGVQAMEAVIVVAAALTFVIREVKEMLAEQFKKASRKEGRREIIEEVRRAAEQGQSAKEVLETIEKRESDNK